MSSKILLVGNIYDKHICRLVNHVSSIVGDDVQIDIFNTNTSKHPLPEMYSCYGIVYNKRKYFPALMYKLPKIGVFFSGILDTVISFNKLNGKKYDLVNIHFVSWNLYFAINKLKRVSSFLMLSPWGSDVLRISSFTRYLLKNVYNKADFISLPNTGFRNKVQSIFKIPESKIINMGLGSDIIDMIEINQDLDKKEAKNKLGFKDKYIITIGYNGSKAQNHLNVIEQIYLVKKSLPENLFLLLPMTYPFDNNEYINLVKEKLEEYNMSYVIYDSFLSDAIMLLLRKCTDVFIHVQNTDASSASLQEYLLTNTIVLNASWLKYPQIEKYGKPYFTFDNIEEIGEILLSITEKQQSIEVSESLKVDLFNNGWNKRIKPWIEFYLKFK